MTGIQPRGGTDKAPQLPRPAGEELAPAEYEERTRAKVAAARAGMSTEQLRQWLHDR